MENYNIFHLSADKAVGMVLASKFMKMKWFNKQSQFIFLPSARLSVAALFLFASISNAQFREPQSETFSFQRSGLDSAVAEVACASGDERLQTAVFVHSVKKPVIYHDSGVIECPFGGCDRPAQTGQIQSNCVSKKTDVKWFGDRDVRNDASAYVTEANDRDKYSGVGKIQCPISRKNAQTGRMENGFSKATAFHIADFETMATNAHTFVDRYVDPVTKKTTFTKINPKLCSAIFYDANGDVVEAIPIDFVDSRWDDPALMGDLSNDIAIVKLSRESTVPTKAMRYTYLKSGQSVVKTPVKMVGFHGDVDSPELVRQTNGMIYPAPQGFTHERLANQLGESFQNRKNVYVGDYASNHGSSGSPILNSQGIVIGIHMGHNYPPGAEEDRKFNPMNNYNMGVLFDERFYKDVEAFKKSRDT